MSVVLRVADSLERTAARLKGRQARAQIVNRVSLADLEREGWHSVEPVFVLSTGRCGTKLLTELLEAVDGAAPAHAPRPELVRVSRLAYERVDAEPALFAEVIKTAREELVWEAHRRGEAYVETNQCVTFFAPVLPSVFPRARFVHLVRHPGDIVRSGIRRNWYAGNPRDIGRIVPPDAETGGWAERDPIGRIGWLWQETNAFVERFRETVPAERFLFARAEELFSRPATAEEILRFCGVEPPPRERIAARLASPVNPQREREFPPFAEWTEEQRALLRDAAPLATRYGYEL